MKKSFLFLAVFAFAQFAHAAAPFGNMYVFGDSFSDAGNFYNNADYSYGGRFTNGPVMNEQLADKLIAAGYLSGSVPKNSNGGTISDGFTNFAYGGAKAEGDNASYGFTIPSAYNQITKDVITSIEGVDCYGFAHYKASFASNDLVILMAGINDFNFADSSVKSDYEQLRLLSSSVAASIKKSAEALIALDAKHIVMANYMDDSLSPKIAEEEKLYIKYYLETLSADLQAAYNELSEENAEVNFYFLDIMGEFERIYKDAGSYGFTVLDSAIVDSDGTDLDSYAWFDVHPSAKMHEYLAAYAFSVIAPIPEVSAYSFFLGAIAVFIAFTARRLGK